MENTAPVRSASEIEALKQQWLCDPCWDIEYTEGFEAYREELAAWRRSQAFANRKQEQKRLRDKAKRLGCNVELVKYIERLERTLDSLAEFHYSAYYDEPIPYPIYPIGRR